MILISKCVGFYHKKIEKNLNTESFLYFAVYLAYLLYGLCTIYKARDDILKVAQYEFSNGWFAAQKRDDSNDELENFNNFIKDWWFWYLLHAMISAVVARYWPQRRNLAHALACVVALMCTVRLLFIAILLCQLLSYYALGLRRSKLLTWLLSAVWMLIINMIKQSEMWYRTLGYTEYFTLIITLSWSLLRCCSFVLSKLNDDKSISSNSQSHSHSRRLLEERYSLENFFGYTLYFPCLVYGPFLSYKRYNTQKQQQQLQQSSTFSTSNTTFITKLKSLILSLLRVAFWWFVLQFALHFLYIHYMARDIAAVKVVTPTNTNFAQHAIGYFMGQFFFLYYVVSYGLGIAFAHYDDLEPPHRPRCIGCIHSYADMWKYFDEGLYEFLFKHIYAEICCKNSTLILKLFATAATFAFVFVWHGCYTYVLIWSVLNFSCLVAEKSFKAFVSTSFYQAWISRNLSPKNAQRLYALLATQLFIPAAFSNVYFISGQDVGDYLMRGAYRSGLLNYLALTFCSYCFFQCSEILAQRKQYEIKTKQGL